MTINYLKLRESESKTIRSKVKFVWVFKDELKQTLDILEQKIEKEVQKHFKIWYITLWNNYIKLKINDEEKKIVRIINCVFRYDRSDEKYWNVDIEFESTELSKKPHFHYVWKYNILDREKIIEKVLNDLIASIDEIY